MVTYDFMKYVKPMMVINDPNVTPIAYLSSTDKVVIASKKLVDHTVVYGSLPIHDPALYKEILRKAGVHIYNESTTETTMVHDGMIWIYTIEGGKRTLKLKNGKCVEVELPKYSTILFNGETGEKIF